MSKIREKESLECGRMHIWALKTQKLPGPLSGPWTPAANCSLRSHDSASLRRQLLASAPGAPPLTKSWIRTWSYSVAKPFDYGEPHLKASIHKSPISLSGMYKM